MKARFHYSPSFDFFHWLVMVKAKGCTEVVIDDRMNKTKWIGEAALERVKSIIIPGAALAGLKCSKGNAGRRHKGICLQDLVEFWNSGKRFTRLKSVLPAGNAQYTITLRTSDRWPERNSNVAAWREFAAEIGALVIEDYAVKPMPLHQRVALYAGARMNFFVTNGPAGLCYTTPYPMMQFDVQKCAGIMRQCGIATGGKLPWMTKDQLMIWEPDDLPVIRRHFEGWNETAQRDMATEPRAAYGGVVR
jgi:hypothetical protein